MSRQLRLFDQWNLRPRAPIGGVASAFIDKTLHRWKLKTLNDPEMRYKAPNAPYATREVEESRLAAKNNNGLVFLAPILRTIYRDATFVNLLRNPFALYEGHARRGLTRSPAEFAKFYITMVRGMQSLETAGLRVVTIRFEDLLTRPDDLILRLYSFVGLDHRSLEILRFKAKPHVRLDGSYGTDLEAGRHHWLSFSEVREFLRPEVNQLQAERVEVSEKDELRSLLGGILAELGYD